MIDEKDDLYEIVGQELKQGEERPGLMARATAEADGNPEKAKSLYIKYRIAELSQAPQFAVEKKKGEQPANLHARGTLEASQVEEIQALLAQPLTIDSCQQILTMLGLRLIEQDPGTWAVDARKGSKSFFYSFDEIKKYTETSAVLALTTPGIGLVQTVNSNRSPAGIQCTQASQINASKKPAFAERDENPILPLVKKSLLVVLSILGFAAMSTPIGTIILQAAMVVTGLVALILGKIWLIPDKYTVNPSTARMIGGLLVSAVPLSLICGAVVMNQYGNTNNTQTRGILTELGIFGSVALVSYIIYRAARQRK
jgi:hypothetical protein